MKQRRQREQLKAREEAFKALSESKQVKERFEEGKFIVPTLKKELPKRQRTYKTTKAQPRPVEGQVIKIYPKATVKSMKYEIPGQPPMPPVIGAEGRAGLRKTVSSGATQPQRPVQMPQVTALEHTIYEQQEEELMLPKASESSAILEKKRLEKPKVEAAPTLERQQLLGRRTSRLERGKSLPSTLKQGDIQKEFGQQTVQVPSVTAPEYEIFGQKEEELKISPVLQPAQSQANAPEITSEEALEATKEADRVRLQKHLEEIKKRKEILAKKDQEKREKKAAKKQQRQQAEAEILKEAELEFQRQQEQMRAQEQKRQEEILKENLRALQNELTVLSQRLQHN